MKLKPEFSLYPYQSEALEWMMKIRKQEIYGSCGGVLFMDMGLGKSFTALEYLRKSNINNRKIAVEEAKHFPKQITDLFRDYTFETDTKPSLVICSKTLINEWVNQIEKFYKVKPKYLILHNDYNKIKNISVDDLKQYDIVFTTYHMVARANKILKRSERYIYKNGEGRYQYYVIEENTNGYLTRNLTGISIIYGLLWENVICDECQTLTNWRTSFFKSIYSLASKYRFGLSGTPIKNNKNELIALLKFMKVRGFNEMRGWSKDIIPKATFRLFKKIDYKTAKITLPDTNHHEIRINMNKRHGRIYAKYVEELWELYKRKNTDDNPDNNIMAIMGLFTRLRQICLDPYLLTLNKTSLEQYENTMKDSIDNLTFNNQKLIEIERIVNEKNQRNEKVIIFSAFTSYLTKLNKYLDNKSIENTIILSKDSITARQKKIENWKKSKTNNILIMNYVIGAEGLNLVEANNIILLDTWWNFSLEAQAIARVKRIGQTQKINVYRLLMSNTIEDLILQKSQSKMGLFEKLKNKEKISTVKLSRENINGLLIELKKNIKNIIS